MDRFYVAGIISLMNEIEVLFPLWTCKCQLQLLLGMAEGISKLESKAECEMFLKAMLGLTNNPYKQ